MRTRLPGLSGVLLFALTAVAQQQPSAEVASSQVVFKSATTLVPVTVVVRDGRGNAVGSLQASDFQIFDNGKPQTISKFSVEKFELPRVPHSPAASVPTFPTPAAKPADDRIPSRFVAYLFDDLHMSFSDLNLTRAAARAQIDSQIQGDARAAIFTTSGQQMQEFSDDPDKLHHALDAIGVGRASAGAARQQTQCPSMTYYMGDLIVNHDDARALQVAVADTMRCANLAPQQADVAAQMAKTAAREAVLTGDQDTESSFEAVRNVVARMASMPGQRNIVLVSPGFLVTADHLDEQNGIIERAIRANVVIGALDARGLYTTSVDASAGNINPATQAQKNMFTTMSSIQQAEVMGTLADGTGGTFYQGTNDYAEGFARTAAAPEFIYVIAFSPLNLKYDGRFHDLRVTVRAVKGLTIQARKGYYAPRHATDPAEQTRQEIQETFFSNEEVHGLPVRLLADFFKDGDAATITVTARVDAARLALRKENGRNLDTLTLVVGVFDQNGNFISAFQKIIELRLKDETLASWIKSGIENATDFAVPPGRYLVRLVVRDAEGAELSAQSTGVEIPN